MTEEDEIFAPFQTPQSPPQLESEEGSDLPDLFYAAPDWDPEAFGVEVATLFRNHVALRSAFRFALEQARMFELEMRNQDEPRDLYRTQGKVVGLSGYINALMAHLEQAEQPKEKSQ